MEPTIVAVADPPVKPQVSPPTAKFRRRKELPWVVYNPFVPGPLPGRRIRGPVRSRGGLMEVGQTERTYSHYAGVYDLIFDPCETHNLADAH